MASSLTSPKGLLILPSGYYLHSTAVPSSTWKKIKASAKVSPKVDENSHMARRAKIQGRKVAVKYVNAISEKDDRGYTWIPRTWFEDWPELIQFRRAIEASRTKQIEHTRLPQPLHCDVTLKQIQVDVMSEVFSYPGITSGCLALHTGFGKTVVALKLIAQLGVRCLWMSHTTQLIKQLGERAKTFLDVDVCTMDEYNPLQPAEIVICTVQSVLHRDISPEFVKDFGLLIVDEVHHMSAPSFSKSLQKLGGIPYTIGLSATLERKDGMECIFQWSMGRVLSVRTLQIKTIPLVHVYNGFWNVDITLNKAGEPMFSQAVTDMARLEEYNQKILAVLKSIYEENSERRVLVLTDRKEHIMLLQSMLGESSLRIGTLHGNMKESAIAATLHADPPHQLLLATYGLAGEGFDYPGLNCVLMATPRNDIRQSVGRILGERVTSVRPLIVDIRNTMGLFYKQGKERMKYYIESGFDVQEFDKTKGKRKVQEIDPEPQEASDRMHDFLQDV